MYPKINHLTPGKFNSSALKSCWAPKGSRILFQLPTISFFTGKLLNFGGVDFAVKMVGKKFQKPPTRQNGGFLHGGDDCILKGVAGVYPHLPS